MDYNPSTLSVSSDGRLLMVKVPSSLLMIYGSDAELIRTIRFPRDIKNIEILLHAVETSIGNFIILYRLEGKEEWGICELTRDGQMIIRRFIPSNETQQLNSPDYLSLDSDDRVFVADEGNHRMVLLDSDLKWNRILCPTKDEEEETKILRPRALCYDEKNKQLIVGGYFGDGANVYTLS